MNLKTWSVLAVVLISVQMLVVYTVTRLNRDVFDGRPAAAYAAAVADLATNRVDNPAHKDPAIAGLLALLEKGIQTGRHLTALPRRVADAMRLALARDVDINAEIVGDVAL